MQSRVTIDEMYAKNVNYVITRLHQIVSGSGNGPFKKDSGYEWQLDASNDWWAQLQGNTLTVAHRYSQKKADAVANLAKVLFNY